MNDVTEWHLPKAASNEKKHKARGVGLTFKEAEEVFADPYAIEVFDDINSTLTESRYKVIGRVKRQVVVVVIYTPRVTANRG